MILKIKKYCYLLCSLIVSLTINIAAAQEPSDSVDDLINTSQKILDTIPSFQMDLKYTLFRNKEHPIVIDSYTGVIIKNRNNIYLKIHDTEMVLQNNTLLKVNHNQKAAELIKNHAANNVTSPLVMTQFLKQFAEKETRVNNNTLKCTLTTPKFTQLPYGEIELFFDKETLLLEKQILELVAPGNIKNEKGKLSNDLKYLQIDLSNFKTENLSLELLNIDRFINPKKDELTLHDDYNSYQLIDRTIK